MKGEWFFEGRGVGTGLFRVNIEENTISSIVVQDDLDQGIRIPFQTECNPDLSKQGHSVEIINLRAQLDYTGSHRLRIADSRPLSAETDRLFEFPLTNEKIAALEMLREGKDSMLVLKIFAIIAISARAQANIEPFISRLYDRSVEMGFTVPKSIWEERVLPGLRLNALHFVTIRVPEGFRDPFAAPLKDLRDAIATLEKATTESDFKSAVVKSRMAVEGLLKQFPLQLGERKRLGFEARLEAFKEQVLVPAIGNTQADHLGKVMSGIWTPSSGAAHPGDSQFTRAYASFSIHQAASLLSVIAEVTGK